MFSGALSFSVYLPLHDLFEGPLTDYNFSKSSSSDEEDGQGSSQCFYPLLSSRKGTCKPEGICKFYIKESQKRHHHAKRLAKQLASGKA
jgi:hypothetical protein